MSCTKIRTCCIFTEYNYVLFGQNTVSVMPCHRFKLIASRKPTFFYFHFLNLGVNETNFFHKLNAVSSWSYIGGRRCRYERYRLWSYLGWENRLASRVYVCIWSALFALSSSSVAGIGQAVGDGEGVSGWRVVLRRCVSGLGGGGGSAREGYGDTWHPWPLLITAELTSLWSSLNDQTYFVLTMSIGRTFGSLVKLAARHT
jgi:hypothetical protein